MVNNPEASTSDKTAVIGGSIGAGLGIIIIILSVAGLLLLRRKRYCALYYFCDVLMAWKFVKTYIKVPWKEQQ